jgi:hypothetical protein
MILKWMVKKQIKAIDEVGKVMAEYYTDPEKIIKMAKKEGKL